MLTFYFNGAEGTMKVPQVLTSGMVGKKLLLEFSPEWEDLVKTVVFSNGTVTRDVVFSGNPVTIPAEVLEEPLKTLEVGVYGLGSGGEPVIPTVRAQGPVIHPGVKPSGDPSTDPTLPVWGQILAQLGDLSDLSTQTRENLVAAINEVLRRLEAVEEMDETLTLPGVAADAKAVGDALRSLKEGLEQANEHIADIRGIFPVAAEGTRATHSASEIREAADGGMLPVLISAYAGGVQFAPLRHIRADAALFEAAGMEENTATLTTMAVDEQKNVTTSIRFSQNGGAGQGGAASGGMSVRSYGALGDGVTDDTEAFQSALGANRIVAVPGGVYRLSGGLVLRDNCCLELSQDAVLNFVNSAGNCITLNRSASLKGNHATVKVPYGFGGHVIHVDTAIHEDVRDVEPWQHWSPQWQTARYLTDLNICMADSTGIHQSRDGSSFGTAVYISANAQGTGEYKSTYIWGLNFSGLRIAGPFAYGIRAYNFDTNTYNHEMRIEALIDACAVGVSMENCSKAYICATVQPRQAVNGAVYASCGIQLIASRDMDLTGSRVWDWNTGVTLWTSDKTNIHQHIALLGDCRGTLLSDHNCNQLPYGFRDIRELIYTDTPANFDSLVILQEPVTKWFKARENLPYFSSGEGEQRLCLYEELQSHFDMEQVPLFEDKLAGAIDKDGNLFQGTGYIRSGMVWDIGGNLTANAQNGCTGLISCQQGDVIRAEDLSFADADDVSRVLFFDSDFQFLLLVNRSNLISGGYYISYEETEKGFQVKLLKGLSQAAYAAFNFMTGNMGSNPVISVNEEIAFARTGFLAEGIGVQASAVAGLDAAIDAKLGVIEDGTY